MTGKRIYRRAAAAAAALFMTLFCTLPVCAYDGAVNQGKDHSSDDSMYLYTFDISLYNPCNSGDMDKDAVNEFWFDFSYKGDNGYGKAASYRLDMSWSSGRNLNSEILKPNFIRGNDNACRTVFSVWVPGIVDKVKIHLNMDGGERLGFTVNGVMLNGYRINTGTDYVSSAYYDSDAEIACHVSRAAAVFQGTAFAEDGLRDQYGGVFTDANTEKAVSSAKSGDYSMFYHYTAG